MAKKDNAVPIHDRVEYREELTKETIERGDKFVAINGFGMVIKPGEPVSIPKNYYDVLMQSKEADNAALRRRIELQKKYQEQ